MAYTNDWSKDAGNYNVGVQILDQVITMQRYIDCAVDALGSGEYTKLWAVPLGFALLEAYVVCHTAEGGDTLDIVDDDSSTTVFVSNAALTAGAIGATAARKQYAAAGFICVKPEAALTTGAFTVIIRGIQKSTKA